MLFMLRHFSVVFSYRQHVKMQSTLLNSRIHYRYFVCTLFQTTTCASATEQLRITCTIFSSDMVPNRGVNSHFKLLTSFLGRSETRLSSPTGYVWINTNSHFWICIRLKNKNILLSLQCGRLSPKIKLILISRTQNHNICQQHAVSESVLQKLGYRYGFQKHRLQNKFLAE